MGFLEDVREFHQRFRQGNYLLPRNPGKKYLRLRKRLVREECNELLDALDELHDAEVMDDKAKLAAVAGEACDLLYVTFGTLAACGIDPAPFWKAIHEANMRKEPGETPFHKTVKPAGWVKPDLLAIMNRVWEGE